MSSLPLAALAEPRGFCSDLRFSASGMAAEELVDPVEQAWDDGYAAGLVEARTEAEARAAEQEAVLARLQLSLGQIDAEMQERLRERLLETVAALCEAAIAPLALDADALRRRVEKACTLLADSEGERVLRLHPDDIALIGKFLPQTYVITKDIALERGTLVVETCQGGVEDGPAVWRRAIAEALAQC